MASQSALAFEFVAPLTELLLSAADDKFMLGHRNADWTGLGPILEEDIAFSSLAQDDLAHSAALYALVAELTHDTDQRLAYGRRPEEYRCAHLVELADQFDWATAVVRQFLCDRFEILRLERLSRSNFEPLKALAQRMLAEEKLAIGHADQWVVRLGRGGPEAAGRVQRALDRLATPATWMHEPTQGVQILESAGLYPRLEREMFDLWADEVRALVVQAGLRIELARPDFAKPGGRRGVRSEEFSELHRELIEVYAEDPQAAW